MEITGTDEATTAFTGVLEATAAGASTLERFAGRSSPSFPIIADDEDDDVVAFNPTRASFSSAGSVS